MNTKPWMYALLSAVIFTETVTQVVFAEDVKIVGSVSYKLKETEQEAFFTGKPKAATEIQLLHVELSDEAKKFLAARAQDLLASGSHYSLVVPYNSALPKKVHLGMNEVPVLNQGNHGSCVTFATTAAIDAILNKGDYVSQLCQLQLGVYLQQQGLGRSDWEGGHILDVLNQLEYYGIASKDKQHEVGCGGYYHYPTYFSHADNSYMDLASFQEISEPVFGNLVSWYELPSYLNSNRDSEQLLAAVKQSLIDGNRVVFATLLPRIDLGSAGAVGRHKTWFAKDSWVLTPAILEDVRNSSTGHEVIITGYDDNAVAVDTDGVKHHGLLTLRNSWGWWYGYWGEYYMSYDYFKLLGFHAYQFTAYKPTGNATKKT